MLRDDSNLSSFSLTDECEEKEKYDISDLELAVKNGGAPMHQQLAASRGFALSSLTLIPFALTSLFLLSSPPAVFPSSLILRGNISPVRMAISISRLFPILT